MVDVELTYRYPRPSAVVVHARGADLRLSTSGGAAVDGDRQHPHVFDGFVEHPEQAATALLVVAKVARTRFWMPPGMVAARVRNADPVVTGDAGRLRFESFSACGGVHARLDLLPGSLDGPPPRTGTTNVDFNQEMRNALAGIRGGEPLRLSVGEDVTVRTLDRTVVERKVPLPERWLKGFAEVQLAAAGMEPVLELSAVQARAFLRGLPATSVAGSGMFAVPTGRGARLTGRPAAGGMPLAGPQRLTVLEPLLRFGSTLRGYAAGPGPGAGAWELALQDARLTVTLSADLGRGFSGEGGVLPSLADQDSADDADLVAVSLAHDPTMDLPSLAARTALAPDRVHAALCRLAAAGRVGYDCHDRAFFHRELPYRAELLEAMHPRLVDARALVAAGAVRFDPGDPGVARVRTGLAGEEHVVREVDGALRCTCPWFGRHRDGRGPCKHALAVTLARRGAGG